MADRIIKSFENLPTNPFNSQEVITLIAYIPGGFNEQVNNEPSLGEVWDISQLLEIKSGQTFNANVYKTANHIYTLIRFSIHTGRHVPVISILIQT